MGRGEREVMDRFSVEALGAQDGGAEGGRGGGLQDG